MFRTGIGVDVHAYDKAAVQDSGSKVSPEEHDRNERSRPCMLACLQWPGETPIVGHSDADVAAHAVCDAVLGACGLGDLGSNFGTADPKFANASGRLFLETVAKMARDAGFVISNVSVQVIGERPRLGERRQEAQDAMSEAIGAPVSLAATTTDKLGFLGAGEGIAAVASAIVYEVDAS